MVPVRIGRICDAMRSTSVCALDGDEEGTSVGESVDAESCAGAGDASGTAVGVGFKPVVGI